MATKRLFELSTGDSPGKPKPKLALREGSSRKSLFQTISQSSVSSRNEKTMQCHGLMRESNRNLDIHPPGIPGEFACLVFEGGGNLTFFSSRRWRICLGGREFEFFF